MRSITVKNALLRAEPAAHELRDHAHLALGHFEDGRQLVAHGQDDDVRRQRGGCLVGDPVAHAAQLRVAERSREVLLGPLGGVLSDRLDRVRDVGGQQTQLEVRLRCCLLYLSHGRDE